MNAVATEVVSSAEKKRQKLDRNRAKSALKHDIPPALSPHDIRAWDKAHAKRSDPRVKPEERLRAAKAGQMIEDRLEARQDCYWRDRAVAETVALASARGDQVRMRKDGGAIRELGAGLAYLWSRNRLQPGQLKALKRYGDLYQDAQPSVKSCLNDAQGAGKGVGFPIVSPYAVQLREARLQGLGGETAMILVCDQVCGQELRISDLREAKNDRGEYDDRRGPVIEERLRCAANLLALYFDIPSDATY